MGILRISGTIDPKQFFPNGESDGDTAHVQVADAGFSYSVDGASFKTTDVFDDAHVVGRGSKKVVDKNRRVTIRFQGIDAPELHFRPVFERLGEAERESVKKFNRNFRQFLGETAGAKLGDLLRSISHGKPVECTVITAVDHPNDVCDTYGRVVADIVVQKNGEAVDLNQWMTQNGWALPAFYNSMSREEIRTFRNLARQAENAQVGVWPFLNSVVEFPDANLVFETEPRQSDTGPVIFPKYFRRSCNWLVSIEAGLTPNVDFRAFLAAEKTPDRCYLTNEFLSGPSSAHSHLLTDFVREDGRVTQGPDALVFKEAASTLYDASGKKITSFF